MLHDSLQYTQNEFKNIKNKLQIRSEVRVYTKSCVKGLILLEAEVYHLYDLELFDYMHKRYKELLQIFDELGNMHTAFQFCFFLFLCVYCLFFLCDDGEA